MRKFSRVRLGAREHVEGVVTNPSLGTAWWRDTGRQEKPAARICSGFRARLVLDFLRAQCFRVIFQFAHGAEFISKYQRETARSRTRFPRRKFVELVQGLSVWLRFADATPLYIIAMNDYVVKSGERDVRKGEVGSLRKAYEFLKSTYDARGLPQNFGVDTGWNRGRAAACR